MSLPEELLSNDNSIFANYIIENTFNFKPHQIPILIKLILKRRNIDSIHLSRLLIVPSPFANNEALQLLAVEKDGPSIRWIANPSEKVKLCAVKHDKTGETIHYILDPSEELQILALENHENAFTHMKDPTEKVQLMAISKNPHLIEHIKNPSEKVQWAALKRNSHIRANISEKVLKEFMEHKRIRDFVQDKAERSFDDWS